jgi:uncharacterized protein with HEPN domain
MIDAAESAFAFMVGRSRRDLDTDQMLLFAVVRAVEIVGEAASKITPETQAAMTMVPWPAIVGMRHRLIHGYFDVNPDIVWKTVQDELPPLVVALRAILPPPAAS